MRAFDVLDLIVGSYHFKTVKCLVTPRFAVVCKEWDVYCRLNSECRWKEVTYCRGCNPPESHTECLREPAVATCLRGINNECVSFIYTQ